MIVVSVMLGKVLVPSGSVEDRLLGLVCYVRYLCPASRANHDDILHILGDQVGTNTRKWNSLSFKQFGMKGFHVCILQL